MTVNGFKYGISHLPTDCMAYRDGYRYGAYKAEVSNPNNMHITGWFKNATEIQLFVNEHPEYGKEQAK